jgi:transposase
MSKPVAVVWAETADALEERYRAARGVERRKRLGALWRVRAGDRVAEAGRAAGVGGRTVERWLSWYRVGGLAEVLRRVPGHGATGSASRLTAEQWATVVDRAGQGEFRTYDEARAWVREAFGVEYGYSGLHAALTRLGVQPKVPRPVAEKADPAAREAWQQGG